MALERSLPCARTRQYHAPNNSSEPFAQRQVSVDGIINMLGLNFRQGQGFANDFEHAYFICVEG
jgi:hypothetical protein